MKFNNELNYKKWYYVLFHILIQFIMMFVTFFSIILALFNYFTINILSMILIIGVCISSIFCYYLTEKFFTISSQQKQDSVK